MSDLSRFESRVAALISQYADRAPLEVEPHGLARWVAGSNRPGQRRWFDDRPAAGRSVALGLAVLGLLAAISTGLFMSGSLVNTTPSLAPTQPPPTSSPPAPWFFGLPPLGVAPSLPEIGQLVLAHRARPGFGWPSGPAPEVFLYADGRLITAPDPAGVTLPEQRLTPAGVEAMRTAVLATGLFDATRDIGWVEGFRWGYVSVRHGPDLVEVSWGYPEEGSAATLPPPISPDDVSVVHQLHDRLLDPSSWLPPEAWAASEARRFVPSYYSVCLADLSAEALPAPSFRELPEAARRFLEEHGETYGVESWRPEGCRSLTTDDTRTFVALLDELGLGPSAAGPWTAWSATSALGSNRSLVVFVAQMLPHGEPLCSCG